MEGNVLQNPLPVRVFNGEMVYVQKADMLHRVSLLS